MSDADRQALGALDTRQRFDWLRLSRTQGVGPRTFFSLINRFGGAGGALEALPALARAKGREVHIPLPDAIEAELRHAERLGIAILAFGDSDYPDRLREIDSPPPLISVLGNIKCLARPMIGIVGARNSSAPGRKMAAMLASGLAEAGYVVVSGLARGIDTEAHKASVTQGTIAVLAGGIDKPYPPENIQLLAEISQSGAAVSEMPLGWTPRGQDFPRRNRIISGLSMAIIVTEAARRSGSLITARMANEQGREVFAVPGSPLDPRCEGTNDLLREGASMVTSVEDVLTVLRPMAGQEARMPQLFTERTRPMNALDAEWQDEAEFGAISALGQMPDDLEEQMDAGQDEAARVLALLSYAPVEIDSLARLAGIEARALSALLVEFELSGAVIRHGGNRVARKLMD